MASGSWNLTSGLTRCVHRGDASWRHTARRYKFRNLQSAMRRGFTLIEAIATIIVLATLGSVASTILLTAMNGYTNAAIGAQMQSEASIALDRITRELRKALRDSSA